MMAQQQLTIPQALQIAWQHQHAGRIADAENIYRQVLAAQPGHPDALHLLGTLALQVGHTEASLALFDKAIAANPEVAQYHSNRGEALNRLRRFPEAIAACRQALALKPDFLEALNNLGLALRKSGRSKEAIVPLRQAIQIAPDFVMPYYNLSSALQDSGRLPEAIDVLKQVVALRPTFAEAINNLASLLQLAGRFDEALAAFRQALALRPDLPELPFNLANALRDSGRIEEAIASFNQAIHLRPDFPEAYLNLGLAYQDQRQQEKAIENYRKAITLRPGFGQAHNNLGDRLRIVGRFDQAIAELKIAQSILPKSVEVYSNLGNAYQDNGQLSDAIAAYHRAIEFSPENPSAHHNLSLALLLGGNLEQGWVEYEWRRKVKRLASSQFDIPSPPWDGGDLNGQRILLHAEQGLGDTIHFARYVPLVAERGGKVILAVQPELVRLLKTLDGVSELVTIGQPLPAFETHCPMPSLPGRFHTSLQTIPARIPYLHADPAMTEAWAKRLSESILQDALPKVGIVWAGRAAHENDHNRTLRLQQLLSILSQTSIARFFSLQKGPATTEIKNLPEGIELLDLSDQITDFSDTAAVIANLDLLITVDTSVAHLAGAMGKPVWTLIPANPDWRWMLSRTDTPWYPTMRLFRQQSFQNWDSAIELIKTELCKDRTRSQSADEKEKL